MYESPTKPNDEWTRETELRNDRGTLVYRGTFDLDWDRWPEGYWVIFLFDFPTRTDLSLRAEPDIREELKKWSR